LPLIGWTLLGHNRGHGMIPNIRTIEAAQRLPRPDRWQDTRIRHASAAGPRQRHLLTIS
jgi:hypothetical protein